MCILGLHAAHFSLTATLFQQYKHETFGRIRNRRSWQRQMTGTSITVPDAARRYIFTWKPMPLTVTGWYPLSPGRLRCPSDGDRLECGLVLPRRCYARRRSQASLSAECLARRCKEQLGRCAPPVRCLWPACAPQQLLCMHACMPSQHISAGAAVCRTASCEPELRLPRPQRSSRHRGTPPARQVASVTPRAMQSERENRERRAGCRGVHAVAVVS